MNSEIRKRLALEPHSRILKSGSLVLIDVSLVDGLSLQVPATFEAEESRAGQSGCSDAWPLPIEESRARRSIFDGRLLKVQNRTRGSCRFGPPLARPWTAPLEPGNVGSECVHVMLGENARRGGSPVVEFVRRQTGWCLCARAVSSETAVWKTRRKGKEMECLQKTLGEEERASPECPG